MTAAAEYYKIFQQLIEEYGIESFLWDLAKGYEALSIRGQREKVTAAECLAIIDLSIPEDGAS